MSAYNYKTLAAHIGHKIECVSYGDADNVAVECINCHTVLLDYNKPEDENETG